VKYTQIEREDNLEENLQLQSPGNKKENQNPSFETILPPVLLTPQPSLHPLMWLLCCQIQSENSTTTRM